MVSFEEISGFAMSFGPVAENACRVSLKGDVAVRTDKGYRAWDETKKELVNVTDFCLDIGQLFYIWPTRKLAVSDIILFDGKFKLVKEVLENTVKVLDYNSSVVEEVVPESHVLFGRSFYGKVTNLLGSAFKSSGNKLLMLSMLGKAGADTNSLLPLMLMGNDDEGGMLKFMLLSKLGGEQSGGNSLLPFLVLKGLNKDGEFDASKLLLFQALSGTGNGMDLSKILLMQTLSEDKDLFSGLLDD